MDSTPYIDRKIYKILKCIYKNPYISELDILEKFKGIKRAEELLTILILWECITPISDVGVVIPLVYIRDNKEQYDDQPKTFIASFKGNVYVEDRRLAWLKWFVPIVVSVAAVIVSVAAIFGQH